ncbi:DUF86 domain-containing protein [candidate division KSB1 bacterium]|nr:DUF86 domain-containing protein [candidate division KSB1 bacterium]
MISKEEFCREPKTYKLAERCLQLCIECLIDICHYLISQSDWQKPVNNTEAILRLGEHGVIPMDFAERISGMVNFRNILIHAYLKIDENIVYEHLTTIEDFRVFQKHILEYLKKLPDSFS